MCRTAVYTDVAMNAFALVDDRERFTHGDGTLRTGTYAFLTADTTDVAVLSGAGSRPLILATYGYGCRDRHQFDQFLRTNFDTLSTAVT